MINNIFFGLPTDNINCRNHNEQMIPQLSAARYAVRFMVRISNMNILKSIYYAYCHSVTKYGIYFWANCSNGGKIFHCTKENRQNYGWCPSLNN